MKILIIEPHADDALLCASALLQDEKNEINILTIFSDVWSKQSGILNDTKRTSGGLMDFFSAIKKVEQLDKHGTNTYDNVYGLSKREINKLYKNGEDVFDLHLQVLKKDLYYEYLIGSFKKKLFKYIDFDKFDYIVTTLGLTHIDHIVVRELLLQNTELKNKLVFMIDVPYCYSVSGYNILECFLKKTDITGLEFTPYSQKIKIFNKLYPTETGIVRFNRDGIMQGEFLLRIKNNDNKFVKDFCHNKLYRNKI